VPTAALACGLPQDQQKECIGSACRQSVPGSRYGIWAGGPALGNAGYQRDADENHGQRDKVPPVWALTQGRPCERGDEQHLQVAEYRRYSGANIGYRMNP
jgi:hypothetical protein